ncbi:MULTISPECIES: tripartite tricarboxylate transporter substrate binding protein [unclassified Variovorax]|uniref:Bug family tripartite tricarboxylate transporter substrate binding protein n=1 Tax=unclassified Variovorax TaxID=663243 RepID=UPI00076BE9D1|nr:MULTISPECIES: tripartite tricarboxylate transporter substrate binding protein [unclassified Variovorax]KWT64845.1 putative exported protein [Variovorax sp. WDL1]PNG46053.1 hypothetical protein CHC06_08031 [Variovorax sp. B2]PNG46289.1 hypothetical protein CHC07_08037 [Variovorax sp. B4]VTV19157.1 Argininosuccinate lyase [Variovorax sp. WDL1]
MILLARLWLIVGILLLPGAALADYPARAIKFVVPFPPGGSTDVIARLVARNMSAALRQEIVVENKGGAATIIGTEAVANAAPDGYTVLVTVSTSLSVNPHTHKRLPYRAEDFVPIGLISEAPLVLVSSSSHPAHNVKELVRWLKAKDEAAVGSTGTRGFTHLTAAMFFNAIGAKFRDVPYRGEAPVLQDLMAGHVDLYFGSMPGTLQHVRAGKLRAYGVTTMDRSPSAPDIPSLAEQGLPEVNASSWFGLVAPRGTPPEVVDTLSKGLSTAMEDKELLARMAHYGSVGHFMRPAEFAEYIRTDREQWGRTMRASGIKAE